MDAEVVAEMRRLIAPEDGARAEARARAAGATAVPSPEVGALLAWTAATIPARHAVEIGAGGGVAGLWLLTGMDPRGVLTSVESDPHTHGLAAAAYAGAGDRVRAILGDAAEVLPRLADGGYDLCVVQDGPSTFLRHLDHALRLVGPGGVVIVLGVLDPGADSEEAAALAAFVRAVGEDTSVTATVLPIDRGVALITRAPDPDPADAAPGAT